MNKKIIYLNIMYAIVFVFGATMSVLAFVEGTMETTHLILTETVIAPTIAGPLWYWAWETRHFINNYEKNKK